MAYYKPFLPAAILTALALASTLSPSSAATFYWSPGAGAGGSGTWDLGTANWSTNSGGTGTKSNYTAATLTGSTTSGSPSVTMADTTGITNNLRGMVYGTGIPAGTIFTALVTNTSITLNANATSTGSASLTFSRAGDSLVFGGTAGTVTLSTPLSIGNGNMTFTTTGYSIVGDSANSIYYAGSANGTSGNVYVTNGVSANISGVRLATGQGTAFEVAGNGTLTVSNSTFSGGGFKVGANQANTYTTTVVFGSGNNLTNAYFRVGNNCKAQLMGNNLLVRDITSDLSTQTNAIIENGSATEATLTLSNTSSGVNAYYGILRDGAGGVLNLAIERVNGGLAGFTNALAGTLANTYSGTTTINGGVVALAKTANVDAIAGNVTIGNGAGSAHDTLLLSNNNQIKDTSIISMATGITTSESRFVLNGYNETIGGLTTASGAGTNSFIRNDGAADSTLTVNDASNREFKGAIIDGTNTGKMVIVKSGAGTWTLSGTNTYTGGTTVSAGAIKLGAANRLADTGAVTVSGGTFDLGTYSETVGAVTLSSGTITNGTLTGSSYAVQSGVVGAVLAGSGALAKSGAGTVTLTATNTYNGATTVEAGKLVVNGAISNSAVTVQSGAVLVGSGTVGALTVGSGATLAPGNSAGTLTINGNNAWQNGGSYDWEIFDLNGPAGTGWDLAAATGTLDLNGLTGAQNFNINVLSLSNDNSTPGALAGFNNASNYQWKIASFTGGISGSFLTNRFTVNLAGFTNYNSIGGGLFSLALGEGDTALFLNYAGGGAPIPEPGTWAAAALLACCAFLLRRRRREA